MVETEIGRKRMMRSLTVDQEKLYNQYVELGKEISQCMVNKNKYQLSEKALQLLSNSNIKKNYLPRLISNGLSSIFTYDHNTRSYFSVSQSSLFKALTGNLSKQLKPYSISWLWC
jgi:hypothetical protein